MKSESNRLLKSMACDCLRELEMIYPVSVLEPMVPLLSSVAACVLLSGHPLLQSGSFLWDECGRELVHSSAL